jgi:hypothetical protein
MLRQIQLVLAQAPGLYSAIPFSGPMAVFVVIFQISP